MKQTVMVVDDDEVALALLEGVLEDAGYDPVCAHSPAEALAVLARQECQIVISDWEMGDQSGLDLSRAIRAAGNDHYVYLILLTAKQDHRDRVAAYDAGVDDFVSKPFDTAELLGRLRVAERVISLESADTTIFALAKLAESRDSETGRHLERVQRYSRILATAAFERNLFPAELDAQFVRLIYETSPLHDIGKVAIPDAVLLKPGRLTAQEFEVMKTHTTHGAETLGAALARRPAARFLRLAKDIAETHHERWDGTGYPRGLAGTDIPVAGRIVAVADVFDALSSKRVYKPAMDLPTVRKTIVEGRGKHFDPELVDLFLDCEDQFIAVAKEFAEESKPEIVKTTRLAA